MIDKVLYVQLALPWSYEEMKELVVEGIKRQNAEIISNNELGNLWNAMTYLYEESEGLGSRYTMRWKTCFDTKGLPRAKRVLKLELAGVQSSLRRIQRKTGWTSMRSQRGCCCLKNSGL